MHFELFSIFTTRFSGPQVGGGAVRDWIWPVIGATQDQSVMERLGFEQARLLCTHSPNLNRWGIVSRQNKLDIELDCPVPDTVTRTIDQVPSEHVVRPAAAL